jgi:hypothetical protein
MLHRIRLAMQDESNGGKLGGPGAEIEVDEPTSAVKRVTCTMGGVSR